MSALQLVVSNLFALLYVVHKLIEWALSTSVLKVQLTANPVLSAQNFQKVFTIQGAEVGKFASYFLLPPPPPPTPSSPSLPPKSPLQSLFLSFLSSSCSFSFAAHINLIFSWDPDGERRSLRPSGSFTLARFDQD